MKKKKEKLSKKNERVVLLVVVAVIVVAELHRVEAKAHISRSLDDVVIVVVAIVHGMFEVNVF